jgi:cytoskeletal protein RodZ
MTEPSYPLELATIRKNRGITLEQIAGETKISVRTLEAIERCDFRKLPGGIYDTSYIRQYARAIDYDEDAILAVYRSERSEKAAGQRSGFLSGFRAAPTISG